MRGKSHHHNFQCRTWNFHIWYLISSWVGLIWCRSILSSFSSLFSLTFLVSFWCWCSAAYCAALCYSPVQLIQCWFVSSLRCMFSSLNLNCLSISQWISGFFLTAHMSTSMCLARDIAFCLFFLLLQSFPVGSGRGIDRNHLGLGMRWLAPSKQKFCLKMKRQLAFWVVDWFSRRIRKLVRLDCSLGCGPTDVLNSCSTRISDLFFPCAPLS